MSSRAKALDTSGFPSAPGSAPLIHRRYRVIREIGGGGMSTTLLARDTIGERDVVLKTAPDGDLPEASIANADRFLREETALRRLKHPNVVELLDSFSMSDGRHVLVLEHVRGTTLQQRIDTDGLVPCSEFIPIASQILKALQHIHTKGSVLRDIKPSNIMLCTKQRYVDVVKIIDFGLTRLANGEDKITLDGGAGTPGFMPPEEIRGERVTSRGDIYSLGALFYYALSGMLPFEGKAAAELLYKQAHERPKSLAEVLPPDAGVPEGLVRMVEECLSPDPSERPESAVAMMERLIDVLPARLFKLRKRELAGPELQPSTAMSSDIVELIPRPSQADVPSPPDGSEDSASPDGDVQESPPEKRRGFLWVSLGVAAVALVGIAAVTLQGDYRSSKAAPRPQGQTVRTDPPSAPLVVEAPNPASLGTSSVAVSAEKSEARVAEVSESETGALTIRSTPIGASVFVDEENVGTTPLELDVSPGEHVVRAHRPGFADWSTRLTVTAGEDEEFDVVLSEQGASPRSRGRRWARKNNRPSSDGPQPAESEDEPAPSSSASELPPSTPTQPPSNPEPPKRFKKLGNDRGLKKMGRRALK